MGTCCEKHLTAKIRDYARNAENGAVTVNVIENPAVGDTPEECGYLVGRTGIEDMRDIYIRCTAPAEFRVTYHPKDNDKILNIKAGDEIVAEDLSEYLTRLRSDVDKLMVTHLSKTGMP